jgi:serine/threonine protein kinase
MALLWIYVREGHHVTIFRDLSPASPRLGQLPCAVLIAAEQHRSKDTWLTLVGDVGYVSLPLRAEIEDDDSEDDHADLDAGAPVRLMKIRDEFAAGVRMSTSAVLAHALAGPRGIRNTDVHFLNVPPPSQLCFPASYPSNPKTAASVAAALRWSVHVTDVAFVPCLSGDAHVAARDAVLGIGATARVVMAVLRDDTDAARAFLGSDAARQHRLIAGAAVAVKLIDVQRSGGFDKVLRECEVAVQGALLCPSILSYAGAFDASPAETATPTVVALLSPLASCGTLADLLASVGPLRLGEAAAILRQVLSAIACLHDHIGVAHCDLKPSNVLLDSRGEVYLADFGSVRSLRRRGAEGGYAALPPSAVGGTAQYLAPEVAREAFSPSGTTADLDLRAADVYGIGLLMQDMLTGSDPSARGRRWDHHGECDGNDSSRASYQVPKGVSLTRHDVSWVNSITAVDPASRPTLRELWASPALTQTPLWVDWRGVLAGLVRSCVVSTRIESFSRSLSDMFLHSPWRTPRSERCRSAATSAPTSPGIFSTTTNPALPLSGNVTSSAAGILTPESQMVHARPTSIRPTVLADRDDFRRRPLAAPAVRSRGGDALPSPLPTPRLPESLRKPPVPTVQSLSRQPSRAETATMAAISARTVLASAARAPSSLQSALPSPLAVTKRQAIASGSVFERLASRSNASPTQPKSTREASSSVLRKQVSAVLTTRQRVSSR